MKNSPSPITTQLAGYVGSRRLSRARLGGLRPSPDVGGAHGASSGRSARRSRATAVHGARARNSVAHQPARGHDRQDGGHARAYSIQDHPEVDVAWKLGYPPGELPPLLAAGSPPDVSWWGVAPHQVADIVRDHRPILEGARHRY